MNSFFNKEYNIVTYKIFNHIFPYNMVKKHLRTIGNSYDIIIPKLYLEEMGINPILHDVEIEVKDKVLHVQKAEDKQY